LGGWGGDKIAQTGEFTAKKNRKFTIKLQLRQEWTFEGLEILYGNKIVIILFLIVFDRPDLRDKRKT
jgi:hypothetical protein